MNDWSQQHRARRHAIQRSFDALQGRDASALRAWATEVGLVSMVADALDEPRGAFLRAVLDPEAVRQDELTRRWCTLLAERVHQGWTPKYVLDWWLDRVRAWAEGEVRQRFGPAITRSLRAACKRRGEGAPDALALDAMFTAAVVAAVDAAGNFDPSQPVEAWLKGVAYNVARDHARASGQRSPGVPRADIDPDSVPSGARPHVDERELVDAHDQKAWLMACALQGAGAPGRGVPVGEEVILANILSGGERTAESLSDELSISVKRVYKRTAAARGRLREAMERLYRP